MPVVLEVVYAFRLHGYPYPMWIRKENPRSAKFQGILDIGRR